MFIYFFVSSSYEEHARVLVVLTVGDVPPKRTAWGIERVGSTTIPEPKHSGPVNRRKRVLHVCTGAKRE